MKPKMMMVAAVVGLALVTSASSHAQDRTRQAEPARRPAPTRTPQNNGDDAARRAAARPAQNADEATRRANAERANAGRDAKSASTDEERRRAAAADDGNPEVTKRRQALDRARLLHQRNVNLRSAKLARLRAIAQQKNDKDMLARVERLEKQQSALDARRRAAQATQEDELKRTERPATREATPPTRGN